MAEDWADWEGQLIDGEFRLGRYLGGGAHSAVFATEAGGQRAAIKLLSGEPRHEWGSGLSHPHLLRILRTGRWERDGTPLHYVVMEYADEVLAQVVAERPLITEEARELLGPVLEALVYVHAQGLTHGHLKPANIMSAGEQLKISADGLQRSGETGGAPRPLGPYDAPEIAEGRVAPAADAWSLGVTLVEILTQRSPGSAASPRIPENLPAPFGDIVSHCLRPEPEQRWTVSQIAAHLAPAAPLPGPARIITMPPRPEPPPEPERIAARWYFKPVIAALVAVVAIIAGTRLFRSGPAAAPASNPPAVASREAVPPAPPAPPAEEKPSPTGRVPGKVEKQVAPEVTSRARATIQGHVRVRVAVRVNTEGRVSDAKLQGPRVSRYFSNASLEAARRWKFAPAKVEGRPLASSWVIEFDFTRSGTQMHSRRAPRSE
jgi:TonB family protein